MDFAIDAMQKEKFVLVGGGIAGFTTAIALNRIGIFAPVFEAAPEIHPVGAGLGLAANAIRGFQKLGISDEIIQVGLKLERFTTYAHSGEKLATLNAGTISGEGIPGNFSVHRADLHRKLLENLKPDQVKTGKRAQRFEEIQDGIRIFFTDGTAVDAEFVIAADGLKSVFRRQLLPQALPRYSGYTCWRGIVHNTVLELSESSETLGPNGRFGIVPLAGRRIYWYAVVNAAENDPKCKAFTREDLFSQFSTYRNPIRQVIQETSVSDIIHGDICDLKPLKTTAFGRILLLGDAAHATTPNMGQGACQAVEDAVFLGLELKKNTPVENAFQDFAAKRRARTSFIINRSRRIGVVMQTSNPVFMAIRNAMLKWIPESSTSKQVRAITDVTYD